MLKLFLQPDICVDFSKVTFREISENSVEALGATATKKPPTLLRLIAKPAGIFNNDH